MEVVMQLSEDEDAETETLVGRSTTRWADLQLKGSTLEEEEVFSGEGYKSSVYIEEVKGSTVEEEEVFGVEGYKSSVYIEEDGESGKTGDDDIISSAELGNVAQLLSLVSTALMSGAIDNAGNSNAAIEAEAIDVELFDRAIDKLHYTHHNVKPSKDNNTGYSSGEFEEDEVIEVEFSERVKDKLQTTTHNAYCPNCSCRISKVNLRIKHETTTSVIDPDNNKFDLLGCLACFKICLPSKTITDESSRQELDITASQEANKTADIVSCAEIGNVSQLQSLVSAARSDAKDAGNSCGGIEEEEVIELEFSERAIDKLQTHNAYCPNCCNPISKVIQRIKHKTTSVDRPPYPDNMDLVGCVSCFSIFLPGNGSEGKKPNDGLLVGPQVSASTPLLRGTRTRDPAPERNYSVTKLDVKHEQQYNRKPSRSTVESIFDLEGGLSGGVVGGALMAASMKSEPEITKGIMDNKVQNQGGDVHIPIDESPAEVVKSTVYGGLMEPITSLSMVSSGATTWKKANDGHLRGDNSVAISSSTNAQGLPPEMKDNATKLDVKHEPQYSGKPYSGSAEIIFDLEGGRSGEVLAALRIALKKPNIFAALKAALKNPQVHAASRAALKNPDVLAALMSALMKPELLSSLRATFKKLQVLSAFKKPEPEITQRGTYDDLHIQIIDESINNRAETLTTEYPKSKEVVKSMAYGGLMEAITSLTLISSAAAAGATTLNITTIGMANLISELFIMEHNLPDLYTNRPEDASAIPREQVGLRKNSPLHVIVAQLSYLVFGIVPPVIFGFTFNHTDSNKDFKLVAVAVATILCIILLAIGKAYTRRTCTFKGYFSTILQYAATAAMASGVAYAAGGLFQKLDDKFGWFNSTPTDALQFLPNLTSPNPNCPSY